MRTTVIIKSRGTSYTADVGSETNPRARVGVRAGLTAYEAAATAAQLMLEYAQSNPEGGDLMAPSDVLDLVPQHLRSVLAIP